MSLFQSKQEWFAEKKAELKKKRKEELELNDEMDKAVTELEHDVIHLYGNKVLDSRKISDDELEKRLSL